MANCPHCKAEIESLTGFVPQDTLTSRLAAKQAEIEQYAAKVKDLGPKATAHDALARDRDEWRGKFEAINVRTERLTLLGTKTIAADKLEGLEALWTSANASKPEAERAEFGAWLEADAPTHPLLVGGLFAAPTPAGTAGTPANGAGTPTNGAGSAAGAKPPAGLPKTAGPTAPPDAPKQGGMSEDQTRAYFHSREFRALKPADQKAKLVELRAAREG
jgi:hypothetical protein